MVDQKKYESREASEYSSTLAKGLPSVTGLAASIRYRNRGDENRDHRL